MAAWKVSLRGPSIGWHWPAGRCGYSWQFYGELVPAGLSEPGASSLRGGKRLHARGLLAQPAGVLGSGIEMRGGLEKLELTSAGGVRCLREQSRNLLLRHRVEISHHAESLLQKFHAADAGNHYGGG